VAAFAARGEWIVVRRQVPAWVMDPEPYRPVIVLLMDPRTGLVVNVNAFKSSEPVEGFAGWIADQLADLPRHADHRRLRTNDHELAPLLREKLAGDWDVVVAPTPEAEEALASLAASLTTSPGAGGHFADGATPEVVGRFFAAAAPVYRAAPWRAATDAQVLAVNAPRFGYEGPAFPLSGRSVRVSGCSSTPRWRTTCPSCAWRSAAPL